MLKSSKRAIVDGQLRKNMPSLEFNQMFEMNKEHLFQPHEMHWSLAEHNIEAN